jgi:hypothetical protein
VVGRARFALCSARVRIGIERFELSFWDEFPLIGALPLLALCWTTTLWPPPWLIAPVLVALAHARVVFVVTAHGSWVERRVFRIPWRRVATGLHPKLRNCGWDFSEIEIEPADGWGTEWTRIAEWNDSNDRMNREGALLMRMAEQHIRRLHG